MSARVLAGWIKAEDLLPPPEEAAEAGEDEGDDAIGGEAPAEGGKDPAAEGGKDTSAEGGKDAVVEG